MQTNLIKFRRFFCYTQQDMANLINVDLRTYINKEKGVSQFKANEMFAIAYKFKMNIDEIFLPTDFIKHEVLSCDSKKQQSVGDPDNQIA